jgi:hypothetical protein
MPAAVRSVLVFLISFFLLGAQDPPPAPSEPSSGGEAGGGAAARLLGGSSSSQPQAYDKVITKDAKSKTGVFTVHEVKEKYYYEIPKTEGMRPGSATVVLHHSMVKLPEHPMTPRLFDERVGYFSVRQMDYGRDEQRAPQAHATSRAGAWKRKTPAPPFPSP